MGKTKKQIPRDPNIEKTATGELNLQPQTVPSKKVYKRKAKYKEKWKAY